MINLYIIRGEAWIIATEFCPNTINKIAATLGQKNSGIDPNIVVPEP
jgi:hypothetical protein